MIRLEQSKNEQVCYQIFSSVCHITHPLDQSTPSIIVPLRCI